MLTTLLLLALIGQQAEPAAPPVKEKKICRVEEKTGSRLGAKRICRTQAEWDAIAADARKDTDDASARLRSVNGS
ncbi:hypothetical protein [Sphingomonas sp.]|uniref:hypothetical protein n=1 Tax=Sphingomonas sp. TaxID=28214 RepID=UPI0031DAF344